MLSNVKASSTPAPEAGGCGELVALALASAGRSLRKT
jgi:hypothetical protein